MDITHVSAIQPFNSGYHIRVHVCRVWRAIKHGADTYNGLHCLLVDEQGDPIHAFMPEDRVADMKVQPQQGHIYDIDRFCTRRHSYGLRVVGRDVEIQFHGRTPFQKK